MILDTGGGQTSSGLAVPDIGRRTRSAQKVTLHIGVLDQLYRSRSKGIVPMSTGDVAQILEAKYGLFSAFFKTHEQGIADNITNSMKVALEALLMGRAVDPWGSGTQRIQSQFRDFISSGEAELVGIPGTPTKAALRGVNHRLAHPYRKSNPRRPSFRDTGLMMISARAWVSVS